MKKKVMLFIMIILFVFTATGCKNGEATRGIRHAGFTLSEEEFNCSTFLPASEEDTTYTKVWYYGDTKIITEGGVVYERSTGLPFSNQENCRIANFTRRVVGLLDERIILADDNKLYYLQAGDGIEAFSPVATTDDAYGLYVKLFYEQKAIKAITVDSQAGIYYVLKDDGNVYKIVISKPDREQPFIIRSNEIIYSKGTYGFILDFNYTADIKYSYIRTNNAIYRQIASNFDECSKYADIICKYDLKKDEKLMQYSDKILIYNGSTLITTYGRVFNVA